MLEATSKLRLLLSCLLCVLILLSSVDRIPDPPGIKPHHQTDVAQNLDFKDHHPSSQPYALQPVSLDLSSQRFPYDLRGRSDDQPLLRSLIYLDQAADPSPPISIF
ncbi:MAG TPA: hypothetical protein VH351_13670 [Bryobacteraceae bacterium]|jgi:hypothetical protein|nr:hypothetical protein [Bryobacteraceae bacterium]